LPATHSVKYTITTARVRDAVGIATSNGSTMGHDRLNRQYYNSDNMSQWHYAKIKENMLLVKSNIPIPNLEANTLNHIAILKNTVTFSYIY